MLNPAKDDEWYDAEKVKTFMGVRPDQVADLLALKGDAVDNIPGAPGIGDKGAKDLIERFGSLDAALERAAEVEKKTYRESLQNNVERIRMSQRLATIATDVPVEFSADAVKAQAADPELLKAIYKEMEFHSLLKELGPSEDTRERQYGVVASADELPAWLAEAQGAPVAVAISKSAEGEFALDTIGLAWRAGEARAVHAEHFAALAPWLEDAGAIKIACDVKAALLELARLGIEARGFDHDVMLYAFLLEADVSGCALEAQARRRMDLKLGSAPEQHADITLELFQQLSPAVDGRGLRKLYDEIELPLTRVLARMERTGIRIDGAELKRLSGMMETEISRLTAEIHALAGKPFNISSPQQLGRVLFEDLKLPGAEGEQGKGDLDRGRRAGRTGRRARDRAQGAGVPAAHQAQRHLRGRAAGADRTGAPGACTPASTRRARPPGGSRRPIRICRTFRSARSWAARSAPPSCRARDGSCWWPTIRRSSCACWRTCRATSCWWRRSATARTFTRARRRK